MATTRRKSVMPVDVDGNTVSGDKEKKKSKPKWMKKLSKFMDSGEVQVFLGILLMLSLFMSDSWILGNAPDSQNEAMYTVLTVVVVFFTAEVCILSYVTDGYFNSFFFWMDFLGTISILLDIGWVSDAFLGGQSVKSGSVLRATRAAKLGARYGRILRLMKLIKFTKWCPCLQSNVDEDVKAEPTLSAVVKISSELTGTISRRVALLVVSIVIVVPFLAYVAHDYSPDAYLQVLQVTARQSSCTTENMELLMGKFVSFFGEKDIKVRQITVNSPYVTCGGTLDAFGNVVAGANQTAFYAEYPNNDRHTRTGNLIEYIDDYTFNGQNYDVSVTIDSTVPYQWSAFYGIILMILVIGVLFGFSASFHTSIETLVVIPLQKLMSTLRKSATVMIDSLKSLEKEKKDEEKQKKMAEAEKAGTKPSTIPEDPDSDDEDDEDVEAAMLESLVEKLSKIVKHVLPSSNDIVAKNDENVDKATADWLNQQYTSGNNTGSNQNDNKKVLVVNDVNVTAAEIVEQSNRVLYVERSIALVSKIATPKVIDSFTFDVLEIKTFEECSQVVHFIFDIVFDYMTQFKIPNEVFYNFCSVLSSKYINTNTYHTYRHAVDVCHTCYRLMQMSELSSVAGFKSVLSDIEILSVLVAALGHDVGHPAVNNGFLVKTKHALAFQHNDKSPLENMHCVTLYEILGQNGDRVPGGSEKSNASTAAASIHSDGGGAQCTNIFLNLTEADWRESRKVILACILGTDMMHHFEQVKKTNIFNDINAESIMNYYAGETESMECLTNDGNNRLFVMELILHCADISNPFKPFDICAKWADLVMAEFFAQGDKEREAGFAISPGFDRNTTNMYNMQMGFIEFVVQPLISGVIVMFPPLTEIGDNMLSNFLSWGQKRIAEIPKDDKVAADQKDVEIGKIQARLDKFKEKMNFLSSTKENYIEAREYKKQIQSQGAVAEVKN